MKSSVKSYNCRLSTDVIQQIKTLALQDKVSQSVIIARAIQCLSEGGTGFSTDAPHNQSNENGSILDFLKEEIQFKNREIEKLLETINQHNHLLAMFKKDEILIEHKSSDKSSAKESKKRKGNGKQSKKKGKKR
ncbi:MAG: hypothetical protein H8D23_39460 [Candidatus Brocadiales bacterium]|nr:hypothetical protein [Candidatus Brocadiales bacterium]